MNSLFKINLTEFKVRLLMNFAKAWSRIEAAEKKTTKRLKSKETIKKRLQLRRI